MVLVSINISNIYNILDGTTVENKGKLILTVMIFFICFLNMQKDI